MRPFLCLWVHELLSVCCLRWQKQENIFHIIMAFSMDHASKIDTITIENKTKQNRKQHTMAQNGGSTEKEKKPRATHRNAAQLKTKGIYRWRTTISWPLQQQCKWACVCCLWHHIGIRRRKWEIVLLLLLRCQLYLWGSPFWVRFLCMWPCFNSTKEVVTFCLHGRCMLGVFSLPVFTCLWRECQDLLSLCDGMHVHID